MSADVSYLALRSDERDVIICNKTLLLVSRFAQQITPCQCYFVFRNSLRGLLVGNLMSRKARSTRQQIATPGPQVKMQRELPHSEVETLSDQAAFSQRIGPGCVRIET